MKIISCDNFDREGAIGDEHLVADNIANATQAVVMCEALNARFSGDHAQRYYRVVPDSHVLKEFKP